MFIYLKNINFSNSLLDKTYLHRQFWNPSTYTDAQFSALIDHHSLLLQAMKVKHTLETQKLEVGLEQPQPYTLLNDLCPEHPLFVIHPLCAQTYPYPGKKPLKA